MSLTIYFLRQYHINNTPSKKSGHRNDDNSYSQMIGAQKTADEIM